MTLLAFHRVECHLSVMAGSAVLALVHLGHLHFARMCLHLEIFLMAVSTAEHRCMELMAEQDCLHPASGILHILFKAFHIVALRALRCREGLLAVMALAAEFSGIELLHCYSICAPFHLKKTRMAYGTGRPFRVLRMSEIHRKPLRLECKVAYIVAAVTGLFEDYGLFMPLHPVALVTVHIKGHVLFVRKLPLDHSIGPEGIQFVTLEAWQLGQGVLHRDDLYLGGLLFFFGLALGLWNFACRKGKGQYSYNQKYKPCPH